MQVMKVMQLMQLMQFSTYDTNINIFLLSILSVYLHPINSGKDISLIAKFDDTSKTSKTTIPT